MNIEKEHIEELIEIRATSREKKLWEFCDEIRNYLDERLVFIFDGPDGQEVFNLNEGYFKRKNDYEKTTKIKEEILKIKSRIDSGESGLKESLIGYEEAFEKNKKLQAMTNRQYVEHIIKQDIAADKLFDSWLYSMLSSVKK